MPESIISHPFERAISCFTSIFIRARKSPSLLPTTPPLLLESPPYLQLNQARIMKSLPDYIFLGKSGLNLMTRQCFIMDIRPTPTCLDGVGELGIALKCSQYKQSLNNKFLHNMLSFALKILQLNFQQHRIVILIQLLAHFN